MNFLHVVRKAFVPDPGRGNIDDPKQRKRVSIRELRHDAEGDDSRKQHV